MDRRALRRIAANPKIICGYSDITALGNAILARSDLISYSGPHWSSFGMRDHFEPTGEWFRAALFQDDPITLTASEQWTDDHWFADQDRRQPIDNPGWWPLRAGQASGRIVGGNLCTLNLLQGTPYLPSLHGALLLLEDDYLTNPANFARDLTSLMQVPESDGVTGLVIGRFQPASGITRETLAEIISRQPALRGKPVVAGLDFGHTSPMITFPIGGEASIDVGSDDATVIITRH